jgi:hypothetical protein
LHVDFAGVQRNFAGCRDLSGNIFACFDGRVDEGFEEGSLGLLVKVNDIFGMERIEKGTYLDTLSQGMRDS